MHYKKTEISGDGVFSALHAQLGAGAAMLPAAAAMSPVLFTQLAQLSGGRISQFSNSLGAKFGGSPWKARQGADEGGFFDFSAEGLQSSLLRSAESYFGQTVKRNIGGEALRGAAGSSSQGQIMTDFAAVITRSITRNM